MVINHNLSAMYASRIDGINSKNLQSSMEKLSSGERINSAKDGAAELAVSEKMRAQIRGLNKASENVSNGISFINVAEGYLQETTDILQRIRELAVQSANGIWDDESRRMIQVEVSQLVAEVDRIASQAQFNGMNLLSGRFAQGTTDGISFQVGANMDQRMSVFIGTMTATSLGIRAIGDEASLTIAAPDDANRAINTVDVALKKINKQRADLGAFQNRFETASRGVAIAAENS